MPNYMIITFHDGTTLDIDDEHIATTVENIHNQIHTFKEGIISFYEYEFVEGKLKTYQCDINIEGIDTILMCTKP